MKLVDEELQGKIDALDKLIGESTSNINGVIDNLKKLEEVFPIKNGNKRVREQNPESKPTLPENTSGSDTETRSTDTNN